VISFWICGAVPMASALVSFGFSIAAVRVASAGEGAVRYALARSFALVVVATVALFTATPPFLAAIALVMVIVQAGDAVVGGLARDRMKTLGPAFLAVVNLAALLWLLGSAR
jgi:hypothetical protein